MVERGYFSTAWNHDQQIRVEDRMFLDEFIQKKQNQETVLNTNSIVAMQNIGRAGTIISENDPAPKAELVVNSAIVKRAELVGTVKRPELVRRRH
jgi:hypothetical protein